MDMSGLMGQGDLSEGASSAASEEEEVLGLPHVSIRGVAASTLT